YDDFVKELSNTEGLMGRGLKINKDILDCAPHLKIICNVSVGYDNLEVTSQVIKVFPEGVVFNQTPFYAESGGQVSDTGVIVKNGQSYEVIDVEKLPNGQFIHVIEHHDLKENDTVTLKVDSIMRKRTMAHHSVTHLLYQTLREVLGEHVSQQGSLVGPEYLRFDFNHFELIDEDMILKIEALVNEKIALNQDVHIESTTVDLAKERGAIAEFGEKYESKVRLIDMGVTLDLCGGTHVENTSDIERFAIASVESKGSGIYRITALAKDKVYDIEYFMRGIEDNIENTLQKANQLIETAKKEGFNLSIDFPVKKKVRGSYQDIINKRQYFTELQHHVKQLEKALNDLREQASLKDVQTYLKEAKDGKIVLRVSNYDPKTVKNLADTLMSHLQKGVVFIANVTEDKVLFIAKSTIDVHAGNLVKEAARIAGGGGGGRADFAQAGAKDVSKVDEVIRYVKASLL
ncbi:MAG: DHHA1 domain-containing protein, partial [Candidatus Izemoplasmataceae bacterium]